MGLRNIVLGINDGDMRQRTQNDSNRLLETAVEIKTPRSDSMADFLPTES